MTLKLLSSSTTRPSGANTYSIGDLVANSATAGSVVPLSWVVGASGGDLVWARLEKSDETDITLATFSLRLFGASPTVSNGDDGAIAHNIASHIGTLAFPIMVAGTDDAYTTLRVGDTGFLYPWSCPYKTVYGLLEAKGAYTGASAEVFTCYLGFQK